MPKKIPERIIESIKNLYFNKNWKIKKIAEKENLSFSAVYIYTKLIERGFRSRKDYEKYLLKKRGFRSRKDYEKYLANKKGFESNYNYKKFISKKAGFDSAYERRLSLIKKRGFKSYNEYSKDLAKKRGFNSFYDYNNFLVRKRGFESLQEYRKNLENKREKRKENKILGKFIQKRLDEIGMSQNQFSKKIKVSREAVSKYAQGKIIPRPELLKKIFLILDVPYKNLEDLVK